MNLGFWSAIRVFKCFSGQVNPCPLKHLKKQKAYLLGIPTLFIYTLIWMARIAEELKAKAIELGIEGPYTSWRHMFWWNMLGCLCCGPMIATKRFFDTLNQIEVKLN